MTHRPAKHDPASATTRVTGKIGRVRLDLAVQATPPVHESPPAENGGGLKVTWETLLGMVGAAAAIGLWVNVVGGAVLWARFEAADLPAGQVVGIVPNSTLLAIGIQALALPFAVGVAAVGVFYVTNRTSPATARTRRSAQGSIQNPVSIREQIRALAAEANVALKTALKYGTPAGVESDTPGFGKPAGAESDSVAGGTPGFGRVLIVLTALAALALFLIFGGAASTPDKPEYLYAWAIASPFLIFGAATYDPVNRGIRWKPWRNLALLCMAVVGFVIIWTVGLAAGHGWPAFCVALLSPAAALLAAWLPPDSSVWGLSAGALLVAFYLLLGIVLFFAFGGALALHPGRQGVPLVASVLVTTLGLLFLHVVGGRTSRFIPLAVVMFTVVAAWGGVVGHLNERNARPSFDLTAALRKPQAIGDGGEQRRPPVSGYLIARTGDAVLLATKSNSFTDEAWRIIMIPRDQIEEMTVGPACVVTADNLRLAETLANELEAEHEAGLDRHDTFVAKSEDLAPCST
jgi:hypothetical protein